MSSSSPTIPALSDRSDDYAHNQMEEAEREEQGRAREEQIVRREGRKQARREAAANATTEEEDSDGEDPPPSPPPPPPAPYYPSSSLPRDLSPPHYPQRRPAFRSSPPQLSTSLAPYLPANQPSPTSLHGSASTRLTIGGVSGVGGERYLEAQRRAAEEQREAERREKERKEQQREERERERQAKRMRTTGPRSDHQDASPFEPSLPGPSRNAHQRDEAPTYTPTLSSSRRHSTSRPRHNPPPFSHASTPIQQQDRLGSPPMPPSSRRRPAPPSPPMEELFSLTESQFAPLADPPPRPAHESPSPSPSPPPAPIPLQLAHNRLPLPPPRPPQLQHPSSDGVGESQWAAHDYLNPDPPRNPFVDHPIPLSDLLPINPPIAGMDIPDPEEYESQLGRDEIPESQYGESSAGWSAFEVGHVHQPGRMFGEDPSRSVGEGSQVGGARDAGEETSKDVPSDDRSSATENPPQQDSSQTQPRSSQSETESALRQPASPDVSASRVLVEATPSPTSGRSSSPPRDARLPPRSSAIDPRPPLQPRQLALLHQPEPAPPSQDPSSGESIAFLDRSPGSTPVREFRVTKDDSSSGPGSSGVGELGDQEMTPRGKGARRAMLEELEGEGFKSEVRAEVNSTSRKLAELSNGSNKVPRVGSRSQAQRSPIASPTGSLMGPPAPPSSTSPREAPVSPSESTDTSHLEGSAPPSLQPPSQVAPSNPARLVRRPLRPKGLPYSDYSPISSPKGTGLGVSQG